ncbi:MAG TPA: isoprenylcysteine carboxylmethyltransferase family protein [Anaerolineales bacterium]|nr:isoprenylcysteine carboxylmethyltransferase family protein [Anaerolineales bacterium]
MASIAILRWISLASIVFWLVVYWQGGKKVMIDIKESIRAKISRFDIALLIIISLCSLVIIASAFLTSFGLLEAFFLQSLFVTFIGTLLTIWGIVGMFCCRHYLGKYWTAETNLDRDHQIIDTGPYRFVRHPIYTFAIIMYIGFCMVFLSLWSAFFTGLIIIAYILKTKDEDGFLEKNLLGYREYKSRVRYCLIPHLW